MGHLNCKCVSILLFLSLCFCCAELSLWGASYLWTGANSADITEMSNWNPSTAAPGALDTAQFDSTVFINPASLSNGSDSIGIIQFLNNVSLSIKGNSTLTVGTALSTTVGTFNLTNSNLINTNTPALSGLVVYNLGGTIAGGSVLTFTNGGQTSTGLARVNIPFSANPGNNQVIVGATLPVTLQSLTSFNSSDSIVLNNNLVLSSLDNHRILGSISGSGALIQNGPGTLTLQSTNNTYLGGTLITGGGTISGASNNFPVNSVIVIDGSTGTSPATLNFTQTTDGTFNGTFQGTGNITNVGSTAALTLSGNSQTFAGTMTISQGALGIAANAFLGGNINLTGGYLFGTGTIGTLNTGTVTVSGGLIHPGNSPGILNVAGHYVQNGGALLIHLNGTGNLAGVNTSTLKVGGHASLTPGSLLEPLGCNSYTYNDSLENVYTPGAAVTVLADGGVFYIGGKYPILQTQAGVFGTFSQNALAFNLQTGAPLLVNPLLTYDFFNTYLDFQTPFLATTWNDNEYGVAKQLTTLITPTSDQQSVISSIVTSTRNGARLILDQMSGSQYAQLLSAKELSNSQFLRRLYDPLRPLLNVYPSRAATGCNEASLDIWAAGSGGRSFVEDNRHEYGFKASKFEVTAGMQVNLNTNITAGGALSYENGKFNFNVGGSGKSSTYLLGLYLASSHRHYYAFVDYVVGISHNKINRSFTLNTTDYREIAKPDAFQTAGYAEAGVNFYFDWLTCQPFVGLEVAFYNWKKCSEEGSSTLGLSLQRRQYCSTNSRLGVHFATIPMCYDFVYWGSYLKGFSLSADLVWNCLWNDFQHDRLVYFKEFGDPFKIKAPYTSNNSFEGSLNAIQKLSDNWSLYVTSNWQFWLHSSSYDVVGGVSANW